MRWHELVSWYEFRRVDTSWSELMRVGAIYEEFFWVFCYFLKKFEQKITKFYEFWTILCKKLIFFWEKLPSLTRLNSSCSTRVDKNRIWVDTSWTRVEKFRKFNSSHGYGLTKKNLKTFSLSPLVEKAPTITHNQKRPNKTMGW